MPSLCIDDRGLLTLEILAGNGEVISYVVTRAPDGLDQWAVTLARTDGEATYRIAFDGKRYRCSCPHWRFRGGNKDKHIRAIVALRRLIEELT